MSRYSIWLLDYAEIKSYPLAGFIAGIYEERRRLPYRYAVLRGEGHTIMVDVGYDNNTVGGRRLADASGATNWQPPEIVLGEVGIDPNDVDFIIVTHAHFDHFGNVGAFPNAVFYIQEREMAQWLWAMALPEKFRQIMVATDPDDIMRGVALLREGRLRFVNGDVSDILPGIDLFSAPDTHTFGSMWVRVRLSEEKNHQIVLAGDNVSVYESLEGLDGDGQMRNLALSQNNINCMMSMNQMVECCEGRIDLILPTHEDRLATMHPSRHGGSTGMAVIEVSLRSEESSKVE